MGLIERSYSGQLFRPRPEVDITDNGSLVIIATPWGPRTSAKKAISVIKDYFLSRQQDNEATTPFARLTCLSSLANDLRIAVKLANDLIYNEENKNEFSSGIELFVLASTQEEVAWLQIGHPMALLDRPQRGLIPLGHFQDLSMEFSIGVNFLPPLPTRLLGIDSHSDFSVESFRPLRQDRLIFVSRSGLPASLFQVSPAERNLETLTQILSQDDAQAPFWLGILDLK